MAAILKLNIRHVDGTGGVYSVTPRVIVEFERHFHTGFAQAMGDLKMEQLYWLGHKTEFNTLKAQGQIVRLFDDTWLDNLESVEAEADTTP